MAGQFMMHCAGDGIVECDAAGGRDDAENRTIRRPGEIDDVVVKGRGPVFREIHKIVHWFLRLMVRNSPALRIS